MSYTTSVLSKITLDEILKLNFEETLMLEGGLQDISQQTTLKYSQKISWIHRHVQNHQDNFQKAKERRIIEFQNEIRSQLRQKHGRRREKQQNVRSNNLNNSTETRQKDQVIPHQSNKPSQITEKLQPKEKLGQKVVGNSTPIQPSLIQRFSSKLGVFWRLICQKNQPYEQINQAVLKLTQQEQNPLRMEDISLTQSNDDHYKSKNDKYFKIE